MTGPQSLHIGEAVTINGHAVTRVGLSGDGAYLVDGVPHDLARAVVAAELPRNAPAPAPVPTPPKSPASRARRRGAAHRAASAEPELLAEVRSALVRSAFRCTHRFFNGGEAVVVVSVGPDDSAPEALTRAVTQLLGRGLHAERGNDGAKPAVIAAWTKAALAGAPGSAKKSAKRAGAGGP